MTHFYDFHCDMPSRQKATPTPRGSIMTQLMGTWLLLVAPTLAVEIPGFTEPYRTVSVATAESGVVTELHVRVGDPVVAGDIIAQLDDDVHQLMLETARAKMGAKGRLESAKAEVKLRKFRLEKLSELLEKGHGRHEEVERAQADAEIAAAAVLDFHDELLLRTLEHRRLKVELERRKIRSPLTGIVSENKKEVGEFVAPNEPELVTVVQLDPLLAKFSMRRSHAKSLKVDQSVELRFSQQTETTSGVIEEISPVIDAESGTVRVRIRIENSMGQYDSGQRCSLKLPEPKFLSGKPERQDSLTRQKLSADVSR